MRSVSLYICLGKFQFVLTGSAFLQGMTYLDPGIAALSLVLRPLWGGNTGRPRSGCLQGHIL
jgi:hypothetical protein